MASKKMKHFPAAIRSTSRRAFLAEGTALVVSSLAPSFLTSCGNGQTSSSSGTPAPSPTPTPTSLSIVSISSTSPTALNPITLKLAGFNSSQPFSVFFSTPSGSSLPQTPIRAESDGTLVVPAPLHFDASTGNTSAFSATLTVTQNGENASVSIMINDIPQLSDFGVAMGAITRAFYVHQELALGASINAQQAISGLSPKVNNTTLMTNLQAQLNNVIRARNDIDRIITDNSLQIPIGTAADGTAISFNANSVTMMDRIIAQYLLACTSNGTVLPNVTEPIHLHKKRRELPQVSTGVMQTILQAIQTLSGTASFKSTQQTLNDSESSSADSVLSVLSTAAGLITVGASIIAIGAATIAGAPVIAGAAAAVATYATVAGVVIGGLTLGNDIYNVATNTYTAVTAMPGSAAQATAINNAEKAGLMLVNDAALTYLNAEGIGGFGNVANIGPAAESVFASIFNPAAQDVELAAVGLVGSVNNLLIPTVFPNDAAEAANAMNTLGANTSFGQVDGSFSISNSQGSILSGLTGAGAGNSGSGVNQFTSMAAPDGSYSLVLPIGDGSLTYSSISVSAFDPISSLSLANATVDLSGINPNTPVQGPSLSGVCNDTDANNPDSDDPDCD